MEEEGGKEEREERERTINNTVNQGINNYC